MEEPLSREPGALALRLDLTELETFVTVVDLGSFSQAAARMHVSQPSVTARVKRLEDRLKTQLLRRTTRSLEPTAPGRRVYDAAVKTLRELHQLVKSLDADEGRSSHRVVVASTPTIASTVLPLLIHAYNQRFPDVRVRLLDLPYPEVIDRIESGAADLAVTAYDGDADTLKFQLLAEEELVLVVPADHPLAPLGEVTLEQLAPYPLMIVDRYSSLLATLRAEYARRKLPMAAPSEVGNINTLLGMVDAGNGITFLPRSMSQINARRQRAMLEVVDVRLSRRFGIVTAHEAGLTAAARSFSLYLQQEYATTLSARHQASIDAIA